MDKNIIFQHCLMVPKTKFVLLFKTEVLLGSINLIGVSHLKRRCRVMGTNPRVSQIRFLLLILP